MGRKNKPPLSFDKHHLIPRSRGGANKGINIQPFETRKHRALHFLFGNQTPDERVLQVLQWDSPVIVRATQEEIRATVMGLVQDGDFYDPDGFKKK